MGTIRRLGNLLSPAQRRSLRLLLAFMFLGALLELLGVASIPTLLALVTAPDALLSQPVVRGAWRLVGSPPPQALLPWAALGVLILFLVKNSFLILLARVRASFTSRLQADLGERLFDTYLRSPYAFHLENDTARLLRAVEAEVAQVVGGLLLPLLTLVLEGLTSCLVLGALVWMQPYVSLGVIAVLGLCTWLVLRGVRRRLDEYGRLHQSAGRWKTHSVHQGLWGIKDVQLLGRESFFVEAFRRAARDQARAGAYYAVMGELPLRILETAAVIGLLAVGGLLLVQGTPASTAVPTLALFGAAAFKLLPSFNRVANAFTAVRFSLCALDVVEADLHRWAAPRLRRPEDGDVPVQPMGLRDAIEFRHVSFRYGPTREAALDDVSLRIGRGEMVGFVGPSGAGKTTLVDLLLGLIEPTTGAVLVDGKDIRTDLRAWQTTLGYVPQSVFLADDSVRRNVAFGLPDEAVDDAKVWAALDAARMGEFVRGLPGGLDAPVGERGVRLSGGQRQRMAIARALFHDPEVLVLDEATSSLDVEMEGEIVRAIDGLKGSRTVVVVAHRFQSIRNCERIFVLDGGRLVAEGNVADLMASTKALRVMASGVAAR
jgi:ATP-binding cassette subfamily C protein